MRGTIKDVARLAGVSVQTVSNVVNNRPVVRPETAERVLAAARELNYTPNAAARGLATGTRRVVGIVVPHLGNPRYGETLAALNRSLRQQGYAALIGDTGWDEEAELHMVRTLIEQAVDGVILASSGLDGAGARLLGQSGIPVVLLYNEPRQHQLDAFMVDNRGGFELMTRHLLSLGHRRISYIRGPAAMVSLEREAGWRNAMAAYGITVGADDMAAFDFDQSGGYAGAMHLLGRQPRPTALVCSSDVIALGALDAAADLGLAVPGDLAVTGFDDSHLAAMRRVRLTSLAYDYATLAQQTVHRLLQRLGGQHDEIPVRMTVPCEIVVRETCGAGMARIGSSNRAAVRLPEEHGPVEA